MTSNRMLVRRIARDFRYRPLPAVIGQSVLVESPAAVDVLLRPLLAAGGIEPGPWDGYNPLTIARYGLIDAAFQVAPAVLEHEDAEAGIPVLKALGFITDDSTEEDPWCLKMLADELDCGLCVIKIFLHTEVRQRPASSRALRKVIRSGFPRGYFPRRFVVDDACITNAPGAWFGKHFYL